MKIIATAEPQGFGPSANMMSIFELNKDIMANVDFFGTGTCYEYIKLFDENVEIVELDVLTDFEKAVNKLKQYDCLISVMDSKSAILAKFLGLKVVYFDLIFWLWDIDNNYEYYDLTSKSLLEGDIAAVEKMLQSGYENRYSESFMEYRKKLSILAHVMSDKSYVEEFVPSTQSQKDFFNQSISTTFIAPILNNQIYKFKNMNEEVSSKISLCLGGMQKQNEYSCLMRKIIDDLTNNIDVNIIASPDNLSKTGGANIYEPLEYFKLIFGSSLVIAQPGFSTIYEIILLNRIPIILPAQNYGQAKFVEFLKKYLSKEQFILWEDFYPRNQIELWKYMSFIDEQIKVDETLKEKMLQLILDKIKLIKDEVNVRNEILALQNEFILKTGGFYQEMLDFL